MRASERTETCFTCRFYSGPKETGVSGHDYYRKQGDGGCRRYPPERYPARTASHWMTGTVTVPGGAAWPKVGAQDWCGEYAPDTPDTGGSHG